DNPLLLWVPHIDSYLEEFLRHEGLCDSDTTVCSEDGCIHPASYRCRDCHDNELYCKTCIVMIHQRNPYHHLKFWNGSFFEGVTLKALGLKIQLGHKIGNACPAPIPAFNDDFTIIHDNGIHQVCLLLCGCQKALRPTIQLLRARLFPATTINPRTAATFRVLETFQMLSFTAKTTAFDFYKALEARTDNTGTSVPPDRYLVLLRIVREWRHIRLLKRMGRGHSSTGVRGTKEGELAVLCPACPLPGINLPVDWKTRPDSEQWLYTQFVAIDANFRLKRFNVSSGERDPGLNHGYAYIVEEKKFKHYLSIYDKKVHEEKSTCHNHDAIKLAQQRGGAGTAANGSGTAECGRHDMKRPNGIGDLQKGERYVNMDYFLLSSLKFNTPSRLVVSYDIGCQWSRNLASRVQQYPTNPLSNKEMDITFLVPKFHLPGHVDKCQTNYSFNLVPGVGRTDGEAPERGWADINAVATSTKEMGPGSRRDTLDDLFGARNWRKITNYGPTFARKATEALAGRDEHVHAFLEFDAALSINAGSEDNGSEIPIQEWTTWCQTWEKNRSGHKNPFEVTRIAISDKEVRLRLAEKDSEAITRGDRPVVVHEDITPSVLIYQGLEIEELQFRSNYLRRKIEAWTEIQHLYLPAVATLRSRANNEGGGSLAVTDIKLYLPSSIPLTTTCDASLVDAEWELRYAMADVTLNSLRSHLLLRSCLYKSKDRHVRGQAQNTRSYDLIHTVEARIKASTLKYRIVRMAMIELTKRRRTDSQWESIYKPLNDCDIQGLSSLDDDGAEGHKSLSWIWKIYGTGQTDIDSGTQDALRIEWCRARARAHRWQEECLLLAEEMRRIKEYFKTKTEWWTNLALDPPMIEDFDRSKVLSPALQAIYNERNRSIVDGKRSYALRQADIQERMSRMCQQEWEGLSEKLLTMGNRDATVMVEHE
ncbi:hypothetical protein HYPSUDRAFT_136378, partial [Hypholoma sublateritium FD-334 SS-4]